MLPEARKLIQNPTTRKFLKHVYEEFRGAAGELLVGEIIKAIEHGVQERINMSGGREEVLPLEANIASRDPSSDPTAVGHPPPSGAKLQPNLRVKALTLELPNTKHNAALLPKEIEEITAMYVTKRAEKRVRMSPAIQEIIDQLNSKTTDSAPSDQSNTKQPRVVPKNQGIT